MTQAMQTTKQMPATTQTDNTAFSRKVRRMLGLDLHGWEQLMLLSLLGAGALAIAVFVTTASVVVLQRHETTEANKELEKYKLSVDGRVADAKKEGIEAGKVAGNALVRAAELERDAAVARLQTEQIKQVVAWRVIPPEKVIKLRESLAAKPGRVNLRFTNGDAEALFLAIQISRILTDAGWQVAPGSENSNALLFGLHLPEPLNEDMTSLRSAFTAVEIPFSTQGVPNTGSSVGMNISTFPGAPTLIIGSRPPPILQ